MVHFRQKDTLHIIQGIPDGTIDRRTAPVGQWILQRPRRVRLLQIRAGKVSSAVGGTPNLARKASGLIDHDAQGLQSAV